MPREAEVTNRRTRTPVWLWLLGGVAAAYLALVLVTSMANARTSEEVGYVVGYVGMAVVSPSWPASSTFDFAQLTGDRSSGRLGWLS